MANNKAGVIGSPVSHSLSPIMHNAAYQHLGLDWEYKAIEIEPPNVSEQILELFESGYKGLNVTMPYKEIAFDISHPHTQAARLGTVNTLIPGVDGSIHGYSTDGQGFVASMEENDVQLKGSTVLVIGAGGASKSICDSLEKARANVFVSSRNLEKSMEIVKAIVTRRIEKQMDPLGSIDVIEFSERNNFLANCDIVVNATPVGMTIGEKISSETPISVDKLTADHIVVDTIYYPSETALLKQAKEIGAKTINGIGMLVHQGALAFNLMTGEKAPIHVMKEAIVSKLEESSN